MEYYILDTNLFFNMEAGLGLGTKTEDVIKNMTALIQRLKKNNQAEFFMPPRIVEELLTFFEDKEQPFLKEFISSVTIKSPDLNNLQVSANIFAQYVDETRTRAYRGMNIAEEEVQKAGQMFVGKEVLGKKEFQMAIGVITKNFRDRYRNATRFGFVDSLADLDIIMLAKELNGFLVTTDEGVTRWGRIVGIKEMPASAFATKMAQLEK